MIIKPLRIALALTVLGQSAYAYEVVEDGIKLGNSVYPVKMTPAFHKEIDQQFPFLVDWLLSSEALSSEEKIYWLTILPHMEKDKRQKLNDILLLDRQQLEKLNKHYQQEIEEINQKIINAGKQKAQ